MRSAISRQSASFALPSTGGAVKLLDSAKDAGQTHHFFRRPLWSPDGSFVVYNYITSSSGIYTATIRRVGSGGGSYTTLVNLSNYIYPTGWR